MRIRNKEEVFFYHNVIANLLVARTFSFWFLGTWTKQNQQFIKCSARHSEILKKKNICGCAVRSLYRE